MDFVPVIEVKPIRATTAATIARRCIPAMIAALALAACVTTPASPPPPPADALLTSARDLAEAGRAQAALDTYQRAATADPARTEAWQQIAAINLATGRPVPALTAAQETLQRDPADTIANEVFIDSAMQVAQQAMQRLLAAGVKPGHADLIRAQQLVATMGRVFGDDALVRDELKARYARRAVQRYRAAQARQPQHREPGQSSRTPDPLEVLGGG